MNVADDITDRIYQRLDDQELDIFASAVEESIDFLSTEVFPQYHEKFPSCGSRDQTKHVMKGYHFAIFIGLTLYVLDNKRASRK
jgi:hypothetical protein